MVNDSQLAGSEGNKSEISLDIVYKKNSLGEEGLLIQVGLMHLYLLCYI